MSNPCDEVVKFIPHLRRYAWALTGNRDRADDLVQDTLTRAVQRIDGFKSGTDLRAWLFTIMHNRFIDQVRREATTPFLVPIDDAIPFLKTPGRQEGAIELKRLHEGLQRLPHEQRTALLLVGLEGMSYQETAAIMGVPVGTVKSRLSRARENLHGILEPPADNRVRLRKPDADVPGISSEQGCLDGDP